MGLWSKLSVRRFGFVAFLLLAWLIALGFIVVQYEREKTLRAEILDGQLQIVNANLLRDWPDVERVALPAEPGARVTVISLTGRVLYDNTAAPSSLGNHLGRPEVAEALRRGRGFSIDRLSASDGREYFYSALRGDTLVVRSALPYDVSLRAMLAADYNFFWFVGALTLLLGALALFQHRQALHEQSEKIRIKKQLTNNINHELKTPVASIQACVETLLAHPDMDGDRREYFLRRLDLETERLRRLLLDVGTITRLDEGAQMIERERINLGLVAEEVLSEARLRPEAEHFRLVQGLPGDLWVEGNAVLLHSMLRNLVDNALAYSEGTEVVVSLLRRTAHQCQLLVADDGVGVAAQHLPHLFERFYRVDKGRSRSRGGTGLGLSIVKNAVLFHGGSIQVRNRPGGGLAFHITLPLV